MKAYIETLYDHNSLRYYYKLVESSTGKTIFRSLCKEKLRQRAIESGFKLN